MTKFLWRQKYLKFVYNFSIFYIFANEIEMKI